MSSPGDIRNGMGSVELQLKRIADLLEILVFNHTPQSKYTVVSSCSCNKPPGG